MAAVGDSSSPPTSPGPKPFELYHRAAAEFVGTAVFVFFSSMSMTAAVPTTPAPVMPLTAAMGHGLAALVVVGMFRSISGAHINPVVSLAAALNEQLSPVDLGAYVGAQIVGAIAGAFLTRAATTSFQYSMGIGGATLPPLHVEWYQALIVEFVYSAVLVLAALMTSPDTKGGFMAPPAVGAVIGLAVLSAGPISGGSMNPARSLGPNIAASIFELFIHSPPPYHDTYTIWRYHWIYWAGPVLGSLAAAGLYRTFFTQHKNRLF